MFLVRQSTPTHVNGVDGYSEVAPNPSAKHSCFGLWQCTPVLVFLTVVITMLQVVVCHCDRTEWNSIQQTIIRKGQLRLCIYMYIYEQDLSELYDI